MTLKIEQNGCYIENVFYTTFTYELLTKLLGEISTVGVVDDYTFYRILKTLEHDLSKIKLNVYDFKCVGFRYKNKYFKQAGLKNLDVLGGFNKDFCYTYGSLALKLLENCIQQKQIKPTLIEPRLRRQLRNAYAGGRNEFIRDPDPTKKLYSVDFNQMYFNCLKAQYLVGNLKKIQAKEISVPGFYYIIYESINMEFPILFYNHLKMQQNYFCNGIGEGLYGFEEVQLFLEKGGIIHKIVYAVIGEAYEHNFIPFVKQIESTNDRKIIKLLANNLYGKLAMKDFFYGYYLLDEARFLLNGADNKIKKGVKGYDFYICEKYEYSAYTGYVDISTAATITAKARIKLYGLLQEIRKQNEVCLINTDEVVVSSKQIVRLDSCWNVKIKAETLEKFYVKKKMFLNKRKLLEAGTTKPYALNNGMLL